MKALALACLLYWPSAIAQQPEEQRDILCRDGWCVVREPTLRGLVENLQKLSLHVETLRKLCKWEP